MGTCGNGHPRTDENTYVRPDGSLECRVCVRNARAIRYKENPEPVRAYQKRLRSALRSSALDAYGRACACCGETVERLLTVDHVAGDGAVHRRAVGRGASFLRWLRDNEYPPGFQTLCASCNAGKHFNGGECPHTAGEKEPANKYQRYTRNAKDRAVTAYGKRCACCSESTLMLLCIDHIHNNGADHRRSLGGIHGTKFYVWLRDNDWPTGYQTLCWSCNDGKHWNSGRCPHLDQ